MATSPSNETCHMTQTMRRAERQTYEQLAKLAQDMRVSFLRSADAIAEAAGVPDHSFDDQHDREGEDKNTRRRYHSDPVIDRAAATLEELVAFIEREARIADADVRRSLHRDAGA